MPCKCFPFYWFFFELVMSNHSPKPRPTSSEIGTNLFTMFEIPKYVFISKGFCDAKSISVVVYDRMSQCVDLIVSTIIVICETFDWNKKLCDLWIYLDFLSLYIVNYLWFVLIFSNSKFVLVWFFFEMYENYFEIKKSNK